MNYSRDLIALDFFTVPTATFRVLFVFVVLSHGRRRLVHFNVTEHPTAEWTARQLIDACTRRVYVAGSTRHPDETFMAQAARCLTDAVDGFLVGYRALIWRSWIRSAADFFSMPKLIAPHAVRTCGGSHTRGRHHEARIARAEGSTTTPSDSYRTRTVENLEARAYVSWTNPRIITRTQRRNETCGETLAIGERAGRR